MFFEKFVKPSGPSSYILNVRSLTKQIKFLEKTKFRRKDNAEIATKTIMNNSDIFAAFLFRNLKKLCSNFSIFIKFKNC